MLVIGRTTKASDVLAEDFFSRLLVQNRQCWYNFMKVELGRSVEMSDIILVTGCDLTGKWANAVFVGSSGMKGEQQLVLRVTDTMSDARQEQLWDVWGYNPSMTTRSGPLPGHHNYDQPLQAAGGRTVPVLPLADTQCIFVRGFMVQERVFRAPKVIRAAAEPQDFDIEDDDEDPAFAVSVVNNRFSDEDQGDAWTSHGELDSVSLDSYPRSHSEVVLKYILDVRTCQRAFTMPNFSFRATKRM